MAGLDAAIERARELLAGLEAARGPISARKMFGGAGLYLDGAIFAVLVEGELLLKADPKSPAAAALAADLEAAGAERWRYVGKSRPVAMPYWRLPDAAADDPEAASAWALRAVDALARG